MHLTPMWKLLSKKRISICSKREQIIKTLLIMKLTIILLLAASLQLSARGFTQEITLKENNASIEKVFQQIKKQSGYVFWYEDKLLQKAKPVNISVKNATLEQVLRLLFKDQSLAYEIIGKTVVIKLKEEAKTVDSAIVHQAPLDIKINGKVSDENRNALQGVSIQLKGSSVGTTTDEKGEFQIEIPDNSSKILIFSYVGMQTQEVTVAGKNDIKITLKLADNQQQEVVIVGYGTQRKSQLTAAVSSVKGSDLVKTR